MKSIKEMINCSIKGLEVLPKTVFAVCDLVSSVQSLSRF